MKKIICIVLFAMAFQGYGQFFESAEQEPQPRLSQGQTKTFQQGSDIFDQSQGGDNGMPDQGVDSGNPGIPRAPIDQWWFLLPLTGAAIGLYRLNKKREIV